MDTETFTLSRPALLESPLNSPSSNTSLSSFAAHGLIRVSNISDDSTSELSFQYETMTRPSKRSSVVAVMPQSTKLTLGIPLGHPPEQLDVPTDPLDKAHFVLSRIIVAYQSQCGAMISRDFFLSRQALDGVVHNGSVKISILKELTQLFKRFAQKEHMTTESTESVLRYYEKLLDAFDVLGEENADKLSSYSGTIHSTDSIDSTMTTAKSSQRKKRSSLIDIFSGRRESLNANKTGGSDHTQMHKTHLRPVSIENTFPTRSQKDTCPVSEYISLIHSLRDALSEVQHVYNDGFSLPLTRTVHFMDEYLMRFVSRDIALLASTFMNQQIDNYY